MVVYEMLRWKAPAGLILAIVLLTANSRVPQRLDVDFVECFAGDGEVSLALWGAGLKGSSHDLRYSNLMDFCTPHGFACLGFTYILYICFASVQVWYTNNLKFYCMHVLYIAASLNFEVGAQ